MTDEEFQRETIRELAEISTNLKNLEKNFDYYKEQIETLVTAAASNEKNIKSAHYRINDLKDELNKEVAGIYRTAAIVGGIISFITSIVMKLLP